MTRYILYLLALTLAAMLLWPEKVWAQDPNEGLVAVGGEEILRIRFPAAGLTVRQRAEAIQERLVPILADPGLQPADIYAVPVGRDYVIRVKGRLLVTVTPDVARFNGTTTRHLSDIWVRHLRAVLPQVNVKPNPNVERGSSGR